MKALAIVGRTELLWGAVDAFFGAPELPVEALGLKFPNPVGLAAGLDKYASALPAWAALGFGFTELGGVTQHPQPGNPAPRLFRAVSEEAIINRMGFNNPGAEALAATLADWRAKGRWPHHPVGINLGKSKITPLEGAAKDYAASVRALWPLADFFVVNVSSPNTPNLRQLQDKEALERILTEIGEENAGKEIGDRRQEIEKGQGGGEHRTLNIEHRTSNGERGEGKGKPILVKVSPDLSLDALDDLLELALARRVAGIVAINTTTERPQTTDASVQKIYAEAGGLSGAPLKSRSTEMIRHIYRRTEGKLAVIGVGGIFSAEDAWEKLRAGASLVQVYTGLIYRGPGLAKRIVTGLAKRMEQAGMTELKQAVGSE
jgi:dihydroorotate dehydrogenase